mmetsp:Transcript_1111/g.2433  ORF Transcript_1111/g.2433 Transcript_1111/m.2433 type:complete len:228 (+) Transcript_1111:710-1393(+)
MPMMVPVGMPASTLEEPSRGSKTATNFSPCSTTISGCDQEEERGLFSASAIRSTGTSSSSLAKTPSFPVNRSALLSRSFVMTSSFFWSSPWMFTAPWYPSVSLLGSCDRFTVLEMALQAVPMAPKRELSSDSSGLSMVTSSMNRVRETPVVSHTSSKTGTFIFDFAGAVGASVAARGEARDEEVRGTKAGEKAAPPEAQRRSAREENCIVPRKVREEIINTSITSTN